MVISVDDLRRAAYDEATLALLYEYSAFRPIIDEFRRVRSEEQALWNSASRLQAVLNEQRTYRWHCGYSANEEARGVDEVESDAREQARKRIRFLQKRALRRMRRRHQQH